jgi:uncharacterized protein YjbJ (UPF0337 family)
MSDNDKDLAREGREDQGTGKLEESIGNAAGNDDLATEGRVRQAEGEMKEGLGDARQDVTEAADDARDTLRD